jgi:hypothetical protein
MCGPASIERHQRPRFVVGGGQRLKEVELGYWFDEMCVEGYLGSALPILRLARCRDYGPSSACRRSRGR